MTPDQQARALAEWLDSPVGTPLPDGVDPEVLETVFALRPDLAPPPRVEVDDILAMVTTGPLAPAVIPEPANDPRPSRWLAWGGTTMLLVAVAALFAVNLQAPEWQAPQAPTPAVSDEATAPEMPDEAKPSPESESAPPEELIDGFDDLDGEAMEDGRAQKALEQLEALERANKQSAARPRSTPAPPPPPPAMKSPAPTDAPLAPPPASEPEPEPVVGGSARGDAGLLQKLGYVGYVGDEAEEDGTEADLPPARRASRDSTSERSASDLLGAIAPPPATGMPAAIEAARAFLNRGDPARAAAACQRGLALSNANTADRETLLRLLGDARTAMGDPVTASEAYREADRLQSTR